MVRLSFDVAMWRRGITEVPLPREVRDELAAQYFDHFEPPTPDEGPLEVFRQST